MSSLNLFLPITEVFRYALFVLCQNELYAVRMTCSRCLYGRNIVINHALTETLMEHILRCFICKGSSIKIVIIVPNRVINQLTKIDVKHMP